MFPHDIKDILSSAILAGMPPLHAARWIDDHQQRLVLS
jgi:hypothetical protein